VNVGFKWVGPPDDVWWSAITVLIPAAGVPRPASGPAAPAVTLTPEAQTLKHVNQVKVAWASTSYTDGNILWGTAANPRAHTHSFAPKAAVYRGEWTTDVPLVPHTPYSFTVEVRNTFTSAAWIATTTTILSATNYHSVSRFLAANNLSGRAVRKGFGRSGASFRRAMGV
jgi:hypothetical protein